MYYKTKLFVIGVLLICVAVAMAATPISKTQAEQIALTAVGGGNVVQAQLNLHDKTPNWSIGLKLNGVDYEVVIQAYTGAVLKVIKG